MGRQYRDLTSAHFLTYTILALAYDEDTSSFVVTRTLYSGDFTSSPGQTNCVPLQAYPPTTPIEDDHCSMDHVYEGLFPLTSDPSTNPDSLWLQQ